MTPVLITQFVFPIEEFDKTELIFSFDFHQFILRIGIVRKFGQILDL